MTVWWGKPLSGNQGNDIHVGLEENILIVDQKNIH